MSCGHRVCASPPTPRDLLMCATEDLTPAELATAADLDYVLEREPQLGDGS